MKKLLFSLSLTIIISACSYKPVIDTAGRSGTYNEDKAKEITNDMQHCKQIARENSNLVSNFSFWFMSPQAETKYTSLYRKCLINRGHSVLN
ncbi:hypothetical protein OAB09_05340 [Pelagibacteraceae bacterium]|nr:hypothetical protein [Pelagibacteraceae bacterium]